MSCPTLPRSKLQPSYLPQRETYDTIALAIQICGKRNPTCCGCLRIHYLVLPTLPRSPKGQPCGSGARRIVHAHSRYQATHVLSPADGYESSGFVDDAIVPPTSTTPPQDRPLSMGIHRKLKSRTGVTLDHETEDHVFRPVASSFVQCTTMLQY